VGNSIYIWRSAGLPLKQRRNRTKGGERIATSLSIAREDEFNGEGIGARSDSSLGVFCRKNSGVATLM
jgi:hypothetical protein